MEVGALPLVNLCLRKRALLKDLLGFNRMLVPRSLILLIRDILTLRMRRERKGQILPIYILGRAVRCPISSRSTAPLALSWVAPFRRIPRQELPRCCRVRPLVRRGRMWRSLSSSRIRWQGLQRLVRRVPRIFGTLSVTPLNLVLAYHL